MWSLEVGYDGGVMYFMGYWPTLKATHDFLKALHGMGLPPYRSAEVKFLSIEEIRNTEVKVVDI